MSNPPSALLADCRLVQVAIFVPGPLSGRLDALVQSLHQAGERTSRRELLAALLLAAPAPGRLATWVGELDEAVVEDALVGGQPPETVLTWRRRPGPRQLRLIDIPPTAPPTPSPQLTDSLVGMPTDRIGVALPEPLKRHLDALAGSELLDGASRDDIAAAVILKAQEDPDVLSSQLRALRTTPLNSANRQLLEHRSVDSSRAAGRRASKGSRRRYHA